jgi:hypothetical protein
MPFLELTFVRPLLTKVSFGFFTLSMTAFGIMAECCYAERHYVECRKSHYAERHYAEYCYAECHYVECRYAECRGTPKVCKNEASKNVHFSFSSPLSSKEDRKAKISDSLNRLLHIGRPSLCLQKILNVGKGTAVKLSTLVIHAVIL